MLHCITLWDEITHYSVWIFVNYIQCNMKLFSTDLFKNGISQEISVNKINNTIKKIQSLCVKIPVSWECFPLDFPLDFVIYLKFIFMKPYPSLTHWGRVMHVCVSNLTITGSDNGLAPTRRQAITWTSVGILSIGPLGTNFSEMFIEIHTFSFKEIHWEMSSGKWRPFCLGLNVLTWKVTVPVVEIVCSVLL